MRLIDADALMNAMYHEAFETDSDMQKWDSGCWIKYKMFENAVDNAPTIEPKQEWIPVNEGLPEEREWIGTKQFGTTISDTVLITFDVHGSKFVKPMSLQNGELSRADKNTMDAFYKGWNMLAWMPLPEPYHSGEVTEMEKGCDTCGTPSYMCGYCMEEERMWTPKERSER